MEYLCLILKQSSSLLPGASRATSAPRGSFARNFDSAL
jgi:hypothetical protein